MAQSSLPPGFRFHPTDVELVSYYLKRKIMGKKLIVDAIAEVDLYKLAPWDLPDKSCLRSKDLEWFFFCPRDKKYPNGSRTNRATPYGYWKTSGKDRTIMLDSRIVGMKKTLIFHEGKAPKGDRTDWVMYEYKMEDENLVSAGFSKDAFVLCKIFKKSGLGPRIGEQYGAPFNEDEWDNADAETSVLNMLPSSEVVNPMDDPRALHAVPAGALEVPPVQNSSAACAGEGPSFDHVSAIQYLPDQQPAKSSGDGFVSEMNISNEANEYDPNDFDGLMLEELSSILNDSLCDAPVGDNSGLPPMSESEAHAFEVNTFDLYNELSVFAGLDVPNNFCTSNVDTMDYTMQPIDRELSTDDYMALNDLLSPDASFPCEVPMQNNQLLQYPLAQSAYNGIHDDATTLLAALEQNGLLPTVPGTFDVFPSANNNDFAANQPTNYLNATSQYPFL